MSRKKPAILLVESGPDEWDRSRFWMVWWDGANVRGQIFHGDVKQKVQETRERGEHSLRVVDVSTEEGLREFGVGSIQEALRKAELLVGGPFRPTSGGLGAGLLIVSPGGRVLLVRRSGLVSYPGYWSVPGGTVEPGEEPIQAAMREALEELGPLPWLHIPQDEGHWQADGPFYAFATFRANLDPVDEDWKPTLNSENDTWTWSIPNTLPQPLLRGTEGAVRDLLERRPGQRAQMGFVAMKTFAACKIVNLNEDSPFYLTSSISILDEITGRAMTVTIPFEQKMPAALPGGPILLLRCRMADIEQIRAHYEEILLTDPSLKMSCAEDLSLEDAVEFALRDIRERAEPQAAQAVEQALIETAGICF